MFEEAVELGAEPAAAANWMTQDLAGLVNETRIDLADSSLTAQHLADLVALVKDGTISTAGAKQVLGEAFQTGKPAEDIVDEKGLRQVSDTSELGGIVDEVIAENPQQVEQYRAGKDTLLQFFVGQVMKKTRGSANPKLAAELLRERLSS
jgi:aspartyl-tRNA(Asn)/glutamyl-tRNA(Gln) amidotransferase subunit B